AQFVYPPIYTTSLCMAVESGYNTCFNSKFISFNKIEMKKYIIIIFLCLLCNISLAQMIKSFECTKIQESDSCIIVYSVKVTFSSNTTDSNRLSLVKMELNKRYQVEMDNI